MERFPCDDEYLRTLGRAVYNFSVLEYAVLWVIEKIEPGYIRKYRENGLSAGQIALDFVSSVASIQDPALKAFADGGSFSITKEHPQRSTARQPSSFA